jgi:hypothetical protein
MGGDRPEKIRFGKLKTAVDGNRFDRRCVAQEFGIEIPEGVSRVQTVPGSKGRIA